MKSLIKLSETLIANNIVIVDNNHLSIDSFKYPHKSKSIKKMSRYYYNYIDWITLYIKYSSKNSILTIFIINMLNYPLSLIINLRMLLKLI